MSEIDQQIDAAVEKWHATKTNMSMALGSFATIGLATHSPGGVFLGGCVAYVAARHGDSIANGVRNAIPQEVIDFVRRRSQEKSAQPKDGRDDPGGVSDVSFDFDEDDDTALPSKSRSKSDIFRFSELLTSGFVPTVNKIFVGRRVDNGQDIFVAAKDLCHIAFAGKTGGGKGSLMRLIMAQLCYVGCKVLLLNPHYMRWVVADNGPEFDEDWTPFEGVNPRKNKPYLEVSPVDCADFPPIAQYLEWAVQTLLQERKAAGREGGVRFKPYFIVLDEWPSIVDEFKSTAPTQLAKLLREGRKYGIFVIIASQDFQVKTIGMDGGSVRKCLLTVFYTGGDKTTGKELLNMQEKDLAENEIGKGVVYLRCVGTQNQPVLVRVPFVDNEAVYKLLGPSTFKKATQVHVPRQERQQLDAIPTVKDDQNVTLTLEDVLALINKMPDVDPEDRRYSGDLQPVLRSPSYEQSGSLRVDQVPTMVQQQPAQHLSPAKTTLEQRAASKVGEALNYWNAGHNSVRKLQAATGWSDGLTRAVIRIMENQGIIARER